MGFTKNLGWVSQFITATREGKVGINKVDPNTDFDINGDVIVTGSLEVTQGITGSLLGTATTASFTNVAGLGGFIQGGNSFGAQALIGTNDNQSLALETSGSTRMFISSSGNVGIGLTNPQFARFTVNSGDQGGIRIDTNAGMPALTVGGTGTLNVDAPSLSGGRFIILDNGNVGIGETTPARPLHIKGTGTLGTQVQINGTEDNAGIRFIPVSGDNWEVQANPSNQFFIYNRTDEQYRFLINSIGDIGIGTITPTSKVQIGSIVGGGRPVASPTCLTLDDTFGNNTIGTNFKLKLFQDNATNRYGFGISDSLLEVVAGNGGSIGFFTNQTNQSMRISSTGIITTPNQPAFSAFGPAGGFSTTSTGAFTLFSQTRTNRGGHYNASNGRFTAPVAGVYDITFSLLWRQASQFGAGEISIGVNGANINSRGIAYTNAGAANDLHDQVAVKALLTLNAGDYVTGWIHTNPGNFYYGEGLGYFTGHLIG
jgi:hypothetical protein